MCCVLLYYLVYFVLILFLLVSVTLRLYITFTTRWCKNKVCLNGKTVLITGSNTGIGYQTALECAKRGARVILACRNELKGTKAVEEIKTLTQNSNVTFKLLDFSSFTSVKKFADTILETEKRVDILINNAGVLGIGNQLTEDGLQLQMQINYFGPVLLTLMLLDLLKKSAPTRIINMSSIAAKYSTFKIKNLNLYKNHWSNYADTKLSIALITQELAKVLKSSNVSVFAVNPGATATDILTRRLWPSLKPLVDFASSLVIKSPEGGAQTSIYVASEPGIEHLTGGFFSECKYQIHYNSANNPRLAKELWDETMKILKYKYE